MSRKLTKKQLKANRKNARKSTGPKTPEGKAMAAKNAIKHGLLSNAVVVDSAHESQTDFDRLLDDLRQDLQPHGPTQDALVERAATCYWRLRRAQRYESGCIEQNFANLFDPKSDTTSPPDYLADIANLPEEDDLKNLIRYESMIDRQLHRALHELRQQQKHRQRCLAHLSNTAQTISHDARNHPRPSTLDLRPEPVRLGGTDVPSVQLPPSLSQAAAGGQDLRPSTLDLRPGEPPLRQTNPTTPKTNANTKQPNDLHASQNNASNPLNTDNATADRTDEANHDQNLRFNDYPTPKETQKQKVRQAM